MMKAAGSRLPWGGLGVLVTLALMGCAGDREIAILRNDMERMNRQLLQLQVSHEVAQSKPRELVEGERRNIADMKAGLDELRQQLNVLAERMEASDVQMSRRIGALEARLTAGSSPAPVGSRPMPSTPGQTPPSSSPTGESQGSVPSPGSQEAKRL